MTAADFSTHAHPRRSASPEGRAPGRRAAGPSRSLRVACLAGICLGLALVAGCAPRVGPPPPRPPATGFDPERFEQRGVASWYGPKFHGRKTANGEVYNMYEHTAAHRSLPFGTKVAVTNLDNGRRALVRINDRGPFVKNRVIDLSYAAAKELGMVRAGTAPVRLRIQEPAPSAKDTPGPFYIQTGSFRKLENAESMYSRLVSRGYSGTRILEIELSGQRYWRVQAGVFTNLEAARRALESLKDRTPASFIVAD